MANKGNGSKKLMEQAIVDANEVKKLAVAAAKAQLIEEMAPAIKRLVEREIADASYEQYGEDTDRLRRVADGYGETEFEEGKKPEGDTGMDMMDKKVDDVEESLESMFTGLSEADDEEGDMEMCQPPARPKMEYAEDVDVSGIPTLGEGEDDLEGDMDEEISIDEDQLKLAYEDIMRTNHALTETSVDWSPDVQKGFKDTYPATEWETEDKPPTGSGLLDKDKGEKGWEAGKPPKAQDYTVKESIEKGLRENPAVRAYVSYLEEQVGAAANVVGSLRKKIAEVNLFNSKVLHVNEMLNKYGKQMSLENKRMVINKIDEAKTPMQVKLVAEAFKVAFGSSSKLTESKKNRSPKANAQRARTRGAPDPRVLRESVDHDARSNKYGRLQELAGLNKKVS